MACLICAFIHYFLIFWGSEDPFDHLSHHNVCTNVSLCHVTNPSMWSFVASCDVIFLCF